MPGGRPQKEISLAQVRKLASIGCTLEDMASVLACHPNTLKQARFREAIDLGRANMRTSLRRKQFQVAMTGNVGMLIWMGKQHLGQSDRAQFVGEIRDVKVAFGDENVKPWFEAEKTQPVQ